MRSSTVRRLAFAMGMLGVAMGLVFPLVAAELLDSREALQPLFWATCVAAGVLVGAANFAVACAVVGRHVRLLADAMRGVSERVTRADGDAGNDACQLPITSADSLGDVEAAFNKMARAVAARVRLERLVGDMLAAAAASADIGSVSGAVLDGLMRTVSSKAGLLFSITPAEAILLSKRGFDEPRHDGSLLDLHDGPVAEAVRTSGIVVLDPGDGLSWVRQSTPWGALRPDAVALVPLVHGQRTIALAVVAVPGAEAIDRDRDALDACRLRAGPQLLNALLHRKLEQMAATDELTGVLNRRFGLRRLGEEYSRSVRHGSPLAVFMIDIDHFKRFNDDFGHDAGDEVLRAVARCLEGGVRSSDVVCRYGGEEFLVLAPGAGTDDGPMLAERLRRGLLALSVQWKGRPLEVRASFGVACWPALAASTPQELVTAADEALYGAKNAGRNRVFVHDGAGIGPGCSPDAAAREPDVQLEAC